MFSSLLDPHLQEIWLHKVQRHWLWWHAGREASGPWWLWGEIHPQPWTPEPLEGPACQLSTTHFSASVWTKALSTTNKVHFDLQSCWFFFWFAFELDSCSIHLSQVHTVRFWPRFCLRQMFNILKDSSDPRIKTCSLWSLVWHVHRRTINDRCDQILPHEFVSVRFGAQSLFFKAFLC